MRLAVIPFILSCVAATSPVALADVVTLGVSNQNVTFTGLGGTPTGQGQSRVTWGSCVPQGTNTVCTVSGQYTGLGGGTYQFVLTYPGSGPSPLTAVSQVPGGNEVFFNLTAGSLLMTLVGNNGTTTTFLDSTNFNVMYSNPACTGVPNCSVGPVGLTPNATISGPFTGSYDPTPRIRVGQGVISASNYGAFSAIAPSTWIEVYGTNLATVLQRQLATSDFNGDQAPASLGGTTITVGGKPAFINYLSPHQVNAQVPSGIATGPQPVVVTTAGGASAATTIIVNPVEPGLLAPPVFNLPAGQYVAALAADGITFILPPNTSPQIRTVRAKPGDVIILYGIGFGLVTPDAPAGQVVRQSSAVQQPFQAFFAGMPATVNYAGLVYGYLGLYQFNVVVPNVAASDSVPFTFTLGGVKGPQNLIIPIGN